MLEILRAAWSNRTFIIASIKGELKSRFSRSRIGYLWFVLQPLTQALLFALVLSEVVGARLQNNTNKMSFAVYLMAGMAAWGFFSEIVNRSMTVFIEYGNAMKKIAFPRISLPLIVWGGALINHLFLLGATLFVFVCFGVVPGAALLALPIGVVLISILALGMGIALGILNVFSRDIAQVMSVVLQLWFWLTPIVYPRTAVPAYMQTLIDANPMTWLTKIYQDALLNNRWPDPASLLMPTLVGLLAFAAGFALFRRASPEIVDAL